MDSGDEFRASGLHSKQLTVLSHFSSPLQWFVCFLFFVFVLNLFNPTANCSTLFSSVDCVIRHVNKINKEPHRVIVVSSHSGSSNLDITRL